MMQDSMPYLETKVEKDACIFLEKKAGEFVDAADYDNTLMGEGGHYLCGHTGRVNGPDFRPADAKACNRSRSCFHARGGY